jgi:hypothetical protein
MAEVWKRERKKSCGAAGEAFAVPLSDKGKVICSWQAKEEKKWFEKGEGETNLAGSLLPGAGRFA